MTDKDQNSNTSEPEASSEPLSKSSSSEYSDFLLALYKASNAINAFDAGKGGKEIEDRAVQIARSAYDILRDDGIGSTVQGIPFTAKDISKFFGTLKSASKNKSGEVLKGEAMILNEVAKDLQNLERQIDEKNEKIVKGKETNGSQEKPAENNGNAKIANDKNTKPKKSDTDESVSKWVKCWRWSKKMGKGSLTRAKSAASTTSQYTVAAVKDVPKSWKGALIGTIFLPGIGTAAGWLAETIYRHSKKE